MASLSNINGLFDVHSTGAILFSTSHGTSGQILRSNGNAAPTWVAASTVIGGPYLPLSGGTLTGATATASGISFTVGGALTGTTASFTGNVTSTDLLTVSGDGRLFLGATGETPKIDMMYVDSASGSGWDTRIFTGKTDDLPNGQGFPTSTSAGGYGTQYQANSDGAFFGILPYTAGHYRPVINWGDDVADSPFSFQFNGVDKATVSSAGVITAPTFVGALTGNATTATTLQTARTIAGVSFNGSANISLNNNAITNGAGYTTNTGTVTSVATGTGLTGGTITTTGTLSLDRPNSQLGAVLATYGTTAGSAGRIRCTAPFNTNTGKMFSIEITLYTSYVQHNYVVSAYMYSTTNQWYDTKAIYTTTGTATPDIYVGRDASGKAYISIANASYTGVLVHNMTRGYQTSLADTYDPWTITINSGNENSVSVATSQVWTTANFTPGNYLPLTGGTVTGLTNFTKANGPVVQITKTGSAPGNNATLIVENTYANHSWGVVQEIRGGSAPGTDRPALLFSSPLTSQTWTSGYYYTTDDFAITSNRGYRNGGWGTLSLRVTTSGNTIATTSMQAPIFYDSLVTAYYLDLGAGGISLYANGSVQGEYFVSSNYTSSGYTVYKGYDNWNHFISVRGYARPGQGKSDAAILGGHQTSFVEYAEAGSATTGWFFMGSQSSNYVQVGKITQSHSEFVGSVRSPIFYDSNNTGYYVDPASGTNLNGNTRITNTRFGVSTSGTFAFNTGYGFHTIENNAANEPVCMFYQQTTGNHYGINVISAGNPNNTTSRFFLGQGAASERIKIYSNGNIQNANNSYGQLSDINLKENVVDATPKLDAINQVRIVNFNYIGDVDEETNTPNKQIGVIAQELEEIFPGMVYECGDTEEPTKAVKYSVLVPILVKAMQEQQVIIDDLKLRIEKLES